MWGMEDILGTTAKRAHPNSSDSTQADKKKKPAPAVELKGIKTSLKSVCLDEETIINLNDHCKNLNLIVIHTNQCLRWYIVNKEQTKEQ